MKAQEKFDKVMHEWKSGSLKSSSGEKVKYPKDHTRAVAIALSEARGIDPNFQKKNKGGMMETEEMSEKEKLEKTIVYDNGGETLDRYTVFTPDGFVFGMSETASGFNQFLGDETEIQKGKHLGKKLNKVPKEIEWAVLDRMKEEYKKGGSMAEEVSYKHGGYKQNGEYRGYDNGGVLDEKRKLQERADTIRQALKSEDTPEFVKRGMEIKLADLERKIAEYVTPEPIEEKKIEQATSVEEIKEETSPETSIEKEEKEEKEKTPVSEKPTVKSGKVKAEIEGKIKGEFEGTIKPEGGKPIKVKEKVEVEVETPETEEEKPARNITVPDNKLFWIDIEKKYMGQLRNALYFAKPKIEYKRRTINNKYRIFVSSVEIQKQVFDLYNEKRKKSKAQPIANIGSITGKLERGGKLMMAKKPKIDILLQNKAKNMGLIKGNEKLSDKDLKEIEKLGPRWKKRVQLAQELNHV